MKKKIKFKDVESNTYSELRMKEKGGKKKIKLVNGPGFYREGKTRMTLIKHCSLGDEDRVIIENDKYEIDIDFMTLCDLRDILVHADDVGNNWFGKTKLVK